MKTHYWQTANKTKCGRYTGNIWITLDKNLVTCKACNKKGEVGKGLVMFYELIEALRRKMTFNPCSKKKEGNGLYF